MNGLGLFVLIVYLIFHSPAFILLIIGISKFKNDRQTAKKLFIAAGIYFLIGGAICGSMM